MLFFYGVIVLRQGIFFDRVVLHPGFFFEGPAVGEGKIPEYPSAREKNDVCRDPDGPGNIVQDDLMMFSRVRCGGANDEQE